MSFEKKLQTLTGLSLFAAPIAAEALQPGDPIPLGALPYESMRAAPVYRNNHLFTGTWTRLLVSNPSLSGLAPVAELEIPWGFRGLAAGSDSVLVAARDAPDDSTLIDLSVEGSSLMAADRWHGVDLIDVSDPSRPEILEHCPASDPRAIARHESYALIATGSDGLHIVEMSDPTNPTLIAQVASGRETNTVATKDGTLYLSMSTGADSLWVIDGNHPLLPTVSKIPPIPPSSALGSAGATSRRST